MALVLVPGWPGSAAGPGPTPPDCQLLSALLLPLRQGKGERDPATTPRLQKRVQTRSVMHTLPFNGGTQRRPSALPAHQRHKREEGVSRRK